MTKTCLFVACVLLGARAVSPAAGAEFAEADDRPVRLFILAGQSNMVHVKPAESFTPIVERAFPDARVVVVKDAHSGNLVRMWHKAWQTPEGAQRRGRGRNGKRYDQLMDKVRPALAELPQPISVSFVWMQGEADTRFASYAAIYDKALKGILEQLQKDLDRKDIDFVVGRISDYGNDKPKQRPGWMTVRETQVKFAEAKPSRTWVNTDDLNGDHDGLHLTKEGYKKLGERFAEAAVRLVNREEEPAEDEQ